MVLFRFYVRAVVDLLNFVSFISFLYALATAKMGIGGEHCRRYKQTLKGTGINSKPTQ